MNEPFGVGLRFNQSRADSAMDQCGTNRRFNTAGTDAPPHGIKEPTMGVREEKPPQVNLLHHQDGRGWWVDLEPFFDFSFWMAEELERLLSEHADPKMAAAPTAKH